jgi:hypothetical protein
MKLNVGLSRKVGEPNYGSRGASMNLELELDNSLVEQPKRLRDRIRQLYQLAKASVDEELNANSQEPVNGPATATVSTLPHKRKRHEQRSCCERPQSTAGDQFAGQSHPRDRESEPH